jgi:hypothetical protein
MSDKQIGTEIGAEYVATCPGQSGHHWVENGGLKYSGGQLRCIHCDARLFILDHLKARKKCLMKVTFVTAKQLKKVGEKDAPTPPPVRCSHGHEDGYDCAEGCHHEMGWAKTDDCECAACVKERTP